MTKSDPNSNQPAGGHAGSPGDGLDRALEDLAALASSRADAGSTEAARFSPAGAEACPEPGAWLRLTTGEASAFEVESLLAHAAVCPVCLSRLRQSQRVLSPHVSQEESAELSHLASLSPQWQHRLAVELASTPQQPARKRALGRLAWAAAGVVAMLVAAAGAVAWWQHEHAPEKLLAEAYSHSRSFDLRIPGASYGEVKPETHLRGGAMDRESAPLLAARAQIESRLEKSPTDPHLLQLKARAYLLDEEYDASIDILDRLLAAGPVTPSLLADAASAYFQRGLATSSENDRATALDYLRRADEMAPDNPVVLFNEALVMEDRGQVMNAVETWNRYLNFERNPQWLEEGRRRLKALEDKLNQLKSHQSRMEQHLATPQAMLALAADPATLAGIDEEFSSTLLPRLLDSAFPLPVDRSRGSPCDEKCAAARTLLQALAASLETNHQDPWLTDLLPSPSTSASDDFRRAAHALGQAIDADTQGDFAGAERWAADSRNRFRQLGSTAGEDRAEVERVYALQRAFTFAPCHEAAVALMAHATRYGWIHADATELDLGCDMNPGTAAADNPLGQAAVEQARASHYVLLELRARNGLAGDAVESGDTESAWRMNMETVRRFYQGDYPAFRLATTMAGLALIEDATPRVQLDLLLNRETFDLFALAQNRTILAEQRVTLIKAAIRAGALLVAQKQMGIARSELTFATGQKGLMGARAESEIAMAGLYLDRGDLANAAHMLDDAHNHMVGEDNSLQLRNYAVARGELELALGHAESAESTLHEAVLTEELQARGAGQQNITIARADRDLYAALAGVWLAQGRPGIDVLALWERYRLRILGLPVPTCPKDRLDCLKPKLERALEREHSPEDRDWLTGQILLRDRVLLYRAHDRQVTWSQIPLHRDDLLAAAAMLERDVSSPVTSEASIDLAAHRLGDILMGRLGAQANSGGLLVVEPDPLLGNVPWPSVETAEGPIGLRFNLEEAPSVLLDRASAQATGSGSLDEPLVVGASVGAGESTFLPEALHEARAVAQFGGRSNLLLAEQATEPQVAAHLASASMIHFAGHATEYDGATRLLLAPTGTNGDKPFLDSNLFRKDPPKAARLVVFSACSSGKKEAGWDHGMGDIVDTLAALGVPNVVATRWQIDSASAVPMMDVFYQGLANGLSVPEALTRARQSLSRDPRYSHPYYW
ncbi:MAG: CHAT domain-containing protein, partial [Acidobacteriota bacterium]|nr:CHAT domain-containing protein [Acidobacteriota bacterium]